MHDLHVCTYPTYAMRTGQFLMHTRESMIAMYGYIFFMYPYIEIYFSS